ncbi:MAG: DUF2934 domain-containing protein [Nitrospira sp.]|nr:DUF2934 domain-containing protein [Nitrospira sp.]
MGKEKVSQQTTTTMSANPSKISPTGEKAGSTGQTSKGALTHDHIAQLAYDLYEKRGRQEGRALEDWLNAELQLVGVVGRS